MVGRLTYEYSPPSWSQDEFLRLGGFTVVFLNYNKAFMIERSVRSALNQDYPLLEMFFMDDASSDGSGDTMEAIVRQYRGRHKVSVVRNDENQYITGQWNIVSKLATGNWLGMFCGDDVAHRDRVSIVAERISKYPTLRGISTAAVDIDPQTGRALPDSHYVDQPYFAYGTDSWESLADNFNSNGSTSFWYKSLFADPLPLVSLDDNYLHFRVFVLYHGVKGPVFLYDNSVKTIDYSLGVGICGGGVFAKAGDTPRQKWMVDIRRYKKFLSKLVATMNQAIAYALAKGIDMNDVIPFKCNRWWCLIRSENTLGRLLSLPSLARFLLRPGVSMQRRTFLLRAYCYYMLMEFLGLHFASFVRSFRFRRKVQ